MTPRWVRSTEIGRSLLIILVLIGVIIALTWLAALWRSWEWVAMPLLPEKIVDIVQGGGYDERGYTTDRDVVVVTETGNYFLLECPFELPCQWKPVADAEELVGEAEFCYWEAPPETPPPLNRGVVDRYVWLVYGPDGYIQYSFALDSEGGVWQWKSGASPYATQTRNYELFLFILVSSLVFWVVWSARGEEPSLAA